MNSIKGISSEQLKKIKLVVLDVDGTLVNDEGIIGEKSLLLLKDLLRNDVKISLASGRLHSALVELAEVIGTKTPLISLDGALIKNSKGNIVVHKSSLRNNIVKKSIELAEKYFINIALCHSEAIYYTENNSLIPMILDKYGALYKEVDSYNNFMKDTLEIVFAGDNRRTIEYLRDRLSFPFAFGTSVSYFRSHSHDNIYYLEIKKSGSTKAKGLMRLLKYLNLDSTNAMVIGDWYNDIPMFETKALKVAMANAIPELKRMANIVLNKSNNEDGISEILEALLNSKRKK
ncbi:MAG: Cof-type HAD-IIB family hydrolase [Ignavibacterium sp.]|uniref:Cof-type HAD-IIB family hydrolase n=1 Tax=Ignavibacterium album TaxID=591197 RepID=A0A7V2ZHC5_9BACT|nr:Cof-type HAD-IIB family hydrolase [Ignavibacterium sp.]